MTTPILEPYTRTSTGVELRWNRFMPDGEGPFPAAVVVHQGVFKAGDPFGVQITNVCKDLCAAGFMTLPIEYRLAPPHIPMNYPKRPKPSQDSVVPVDDGHYPKQTDDCRTALRTARGLADCNGTVVMVGESAGASHTVYCTARGRKGDSQPDAAVAFSPPCYFDDIDHLQVDFSEDADMHSALTNYLGIPDTFPNYSAEVMAQLHDASPSTYVRPGMCPIFIVISSDDGSGIDTYDFPAIISRFKQKGMGETAVATRGCYRQMVVPVKVQTHAFSIWNKPFNGVDGSKTAGQVAIEWLQGFLAR